MFKLSIRTTRSANHPVALVALALLLGCRVGAPKPGSNLTANAPSAPNPGNGQTGGGQAPNPANPSGPKPDDDFTVATAVPMGLVDPSYLSKAVISIQVAGATEVPNLSGITGADSNTATVAISSYIHNLIYPTTLTGSDIINVTNDISDVNQNFVQDPDANLAIETGYLNWSRNYMQSMQQNVAATNLLMANFFGPTGYFQSNLKVNTTKGKGSRIFKLPAPATANDANVSLNTKFAIVQVTGDTTWPFIVDFYAPLDSTASTYTADLQVRFAPLAADSQDIHCQITLRRRDTTLDAALGKPGYNYAMFEYTTSDTNITNTRWSDGTKAVATMRYGYDDNTRWMSGADVFDDEDPSWLTDASRPRFRRGIAGDMDFFRTVLSRAASGEGVQEYAYVPKSDAASASFDQAQVFTQFSLDKDIVATYLNVISNPQITASCSQLGQNLRDFFASASPPAVTPATVGALPNNLCSDSTNAPTATVIDTAMRDACAALPAGFGVASSSPGVTGSSAQFEEFPCHQITVATTFVNPLYIVHGATTDSPILPTKLFGSLGAPAPSAVYTALAASNAALPSVDLSTLSPLKAALPTGFDSKSKAATAFTAAESL